MNAYAGNCYTFLFLIFCFVTMGNLLDISAVEESCIKTARTAKNYERIE
jgi:hypothetical protein